MSTSTPIDILAGFKSSVNKSGIRKAAITIRTPDAILFDPTAKQAAQTLATAIAKQITENLLAGLAPDGSAMPPVSGGTAEWRKRESAQGARGGEALGIYKDSTFRSRAKRNYQRDYRSRLGTFTPQEGGPRGVVSGLLAKSFAARAASDGKGFVIFVAARRGQPRPGETVAAIETVFRGVPVWNSKAMEQPSIVAARKRAARALLGKKGVQLLRELAETAQNLYGLAEDIADE